MDKRGRRIFTAFAMLCMAISLCMALVSCGENGFQIGKASYTITYDAGIEGVEIPSQTVKEGSKIEPPTSPERAGYRFMGWAWQGQTFSMERMPSCNVALTAIWEKCYNVSFAADNGQGQIEPMEFIEDEPLTLPTPWREGYQFEGWFCGDEPFRLTVMPAEDLYLTAVWSKLYTITFDVGGVGTYIAPIVAKGGTPVSAPDADFTGYHLARWKYNGKEYQFSVMPEEDITLQAEWTALTNLPSMFIDLQDKSGNVYSLDNVNRTDYVDSTITLTNTEQSFKLNGIKSYFKGRGNGSWTCSKKGYKIKFDKKQSLFGSTANKHWVILAGANFDDPTMCRNYLAFNMSESLFTGIEYTTRAVWVDIYVNGVYHGVYVLCEHVRVGEGRVELTSEYGVENTGYLIEYDAYATGREGIDYFNISSGVKYGFTVHSPDPEDYAATVSEEAFRAQVRYIKGYVERVYTAALGGDFGTFSELADVDSFVDMYILHELFKNVDTGWSSFYLYKKPNGKLYAGPPWDFDGTTNINERGDRTPQGIYVADQVLAGSPITSSELYIALYKTAGFLSAVKARWQQLSFAVSGFIEEKLNETVYTTYRYAMGKNYVKWNNKTQEKAELDWIAAMKTQKQWFVDRIRYLNTVWQ